MKFKVKITKDILKRSAGCMSYGPDGPTAGPQLATNCAFSLALSELVPCAEVGERSTSYMKTAKAAVMSDILDVISNTDKQLKFIQLFDRSTPEQRLLMEEQEFDVEIPDEVIEYWHGDTVKAVQKLIDNPVLTPVL